jgi:hypothetical protein
LSKGAFLLKKKNTKRKNKKEKQASAQARLRAKLKHISQRSAKEETNQDSFSNGE